MFLTFNGALGKDEYITGLTASRHALHVNVKSGLIREGPIAATAHEQTGNRV